MTDADVTAVIFDYGGVLTSPIGDSIREWIDADGVSPEAFHQTLEVWLSWNAPVDSPVHRLERGEITADGFADLLAAELVRTDGSPVAAAGLLDRIFAGVEPDEAMYTLVDDLRALGIKVGLLSNSWGNTYPLGRLSASFDDIVISGQVQMRKPQPEIFALAVSALAVNAESTVFVDDAGPNIDGARRAGLRAIRHTDAGPTRGSLALMIPGLATEEDDR